MIYAIFMLLALLANGETESERLTLVNRRRLQMGLPACTTNTGVMVNAGAGLVQGSLTAVGEGTGVTAGLSNLQTTRFVPQQQGTSQFLTQQQMAALTPQQQFALFQMMQMQGQGRRRMQQTQIPGMNGAQQFGGQQFQTFTPLQLSCNPLAVQNQNFQVGTGAGVVAPGGSVIAVGRGTGQVLQGGTSLITTVEQPMNQMNTNAQAMNIVNQLLGQQGQQVNINQLMGVRRRLERNENA